MAAPASPGGSIGTQNSLVGSVFEPQSVSGSDDSVTASASTEIPAGCQVPHGGFAQREWSYGVQTDYRTRPSQVKGAGSADGVRIAGDARDDPRRHFGGCRGGLCDHQGGGGSAARGLPAKPWGSHRVGADGDQSMAGLGRPGGQFEPAARGGLLSITCAVLGASFGVWAAWQWPGGGAAAAGLHWGAQRGGRGTSAQGDLALRGRSECMRGRCEPFEGHLGRPTAVEALSEAGWTVRIGPPNCGGRRVLGLAQQCELVPDKHVFPPAPKRWRQRGDLAASRIEGVVSTRLFYREHGHQGALYRRLWEIRPVLGPQRSCAHSGEAQSALPGSSLGREAARQRECAGDWRSRSGSSISAMAGNGSTIQHGCVGRDGSEGGKSASTAGPGRCGFVAGACRAGRMVHGDVGDSRMDYRHACQGLGTAGGLQ